MPSTRATTTNSEALAARLREAIESEHYEDVAQRLTQYSTHVARMYESGDPEAPPEKQVMDLMQWALRTLWAARAHASDQFQLLSDSRVYASSDPDRKTWQMMV